VKDMIKKISKILNISYSSGTTLSRAKENLRFKLREYRKNENENWIKSLKINGSGISVFKTQSWTTLWTN
jgi:hypothetical protein